MLNLQTKLTELMTTLQLEDAPAGGSVVVYHKGEVAANASIGQATPNAAWTADTLSLNFSTGKGVLVTLVHILVSEGLLDYERSISSYWPKFAANGKADITLQDVLVHKAGLFNIQTLTTSANDLLDWALMLTNVENMTPENPRNDKVESCYSALVSGWVIGGLIETVTGCPLNDTLDKYLAEPLGVKGDMYFGVPADKLDKVATLARNFEAFQTYISLSPKVAAQDSIINVQKETLTNKSASTKSNDPKPKRSKPKLRKDSKHILAAYQSLPSYHCWQKIITNDAADEPVTSSQSPKSVNEGLTTPEIANLYFATSNLNLLDYKNALVPAGRIAFDYYSPQSLMAKIPAANGVVTSHALAKMYAMLANKGVWQGRTLISQAVFTKLSKVYVTGSDAIMAAAYPPSMQWRLGYHRLFSRCQDESNLTGAFGHMGYDGSVAWCDTDRQLAVAFVHNYNITMSTDIRQFAINEAILQWVDELNESEKVPKAGP